MISTAFFAMAVALVPLVVAGMLLGWNRVPGPRGVRVSARVGSYPVRRAGP